METTEKIYKGVPLSGIRTPEIIDAIIEKRNSMKTNEIAELLGFDSFRPVNAICRLLNKENGVTTTKAPKKPRIIVKDPKNVFKNYYGSGKEKARQLIADSIKATKRQSSNILTLPAEKWEMEKNILKQKPGYKFTAVERDKDTFKKMVKNLIANEKLFDSVIGMENKTIGEVVVNDKEDTYSSAILDYCGFIDTFYDEINGMMKRNLIKKGGCITLTLSENDRLINHSKHKNSPSNRFMGKCYANEEMSGVKVTNDLVNNLVFNNEGYEIVTKFKYRDNRTNMLLFIIKRIDD